MPQKKSCSSALEDKTAEKAANPGLCEGIKKKYLKSRAACEVTFRFPGSAASGAKSVAVVGDFNNWNSSAHPMIQLKKGDYVACLKLEPGKEYQFRYLIDGQRWENDFSADKYVKSPYGDSDNSVVVT
jgi:1,4-alpha-glucan branching enzyme